MIGQDRWRAIELQSAQFDRLVNNVHQDDPNVDFLTGAQAALSWVLFPTIYASPWEELVERNSNFLKVSG